MPNGKGRDTLGEEGWLLPESVGLFGAESLRFVSSSQFRSRLRSLLRGTEYAYAAL